MKKNGFTLVELLAVISILGVIMIITIPGMLNLLGKSRHALSDLEKKNIKEAGTYYITDIDESITNYNGLSGYDFKKYIASNEYIKVSLKTLIELGYYDKQCTTKLCKRIEKEKTDSNVEKVECNLKLGIDLTTQDNFLVTNGYNVVLEGKDCE